MSVLIWVQTVCNCNQQTAKVIASKERVNHVTKLAIMQDKNFHKAATEY